MNTRNVMNFIIRLGVLVLVICGAIIGVKYAIKTFGNTSAPTADAKSEIKPPVIPTVETTPNPEVVEAKKQAAEAIAAANAAKAAVEAMKQERAAQIAPPPAPVMHDQRPQVPPPQAAPSGPVRMVRSDGTIVTDLAPINAPSGTTKFTGTGRLTYDNLPCATHLDRITLPNGQPGWDLKPEIRTALDAYVSAAIQPLRARNASMQQIVAAEIAAAKAFFTENGAPDAVVRHTATPGQQVAGNQRPPRR